MKLKKTIPCAWSRGQGFRRLRCLESRWRAPTPDPWRQKRRRWRCTWWRQPWKRWRWRFRGRTWGRTTVLWIWKLLRSKCKRLRKRRQLRVERSWSPASLFNEPLKPEWELSEAPASKRRRLRPGEAKFAEEMREFGGGRRLSEI